MRGDCFLAAGLSEIIEVAIRDFDYGLFDNVLV